MYPLGLNHPLPLSINQRSRELRWLVRVGLFLKYECLLKNTLADQGPPLPLSADAHAQLVKIPF